MNIFSLFGPYQFFAKIGAVILLAAAAIIGYLSWAAHEQGIGEARATARYNAAIEAQKSEAGQVLAAAVAKVEAADAALREFKDHQEVKDAQNKKTVDNLSGRLRTLAGVNGRLRDPHADARCGDGGGSAQGQDSASAGHSPDDGAKGGGLLSADLSGLLRRLTREADEINAAYISCRADAEMVRAETK